MNLIDLFPIPLYIGKVKHHEQIKEIVYKNRMEYGTPKTWNCSVNSSFGQKNDWLNTIVPLYEDNYKEYFLSFNITANVRVHDIWCNFYIINQFQEKHHHLPCDISCIHYVKLNPNHFGTTFVNPYSLLNSSNKLLDLKSPHTFTPYVEEGDVIIFPSYMEHFVKKQEIDEERITISWNCILSDLGGLTTEPS